MQLCKLTSSQFLQEIQKYSNVAQSEYLGLEHGLMLFWHFTAFYILFCMAICVRASPLLTHISLSKPTTRERWVIRHHQGNDWFMLSTHGVQSI
jgi:hypothetical protein